jgi:prepilin-type N-terminal cleavage/methylation domain-containing protein
MNCNIKLQTYNQKGFTLVEMLVVIAISGLLMSVVLSGYGTFSSNTLLTNTTYELALSIREAQIYGVSVRSEGGTSPSFTNSYGIHIPSNSTKEYFLFKADQNRFLGTTCTPGNAQCINVYTLPRDIFISAVQTKLSNGTCRDERPLNITFKRPNPEPIFADANGQNLSVSEVQITISSSSTEDKRYVTISNNGQVSVQNSICP